VFGTNRGTASLAARAVDFRRNMKISASMGVLLTLAPTALFDIGDALSVQMALPLMPTAPAGARKPRALRPVAWD
jgi:hypothetical protein